MTFCAEGGLFVQDRVYVQSRYVGLWTEKSLRDCLRHTHLLRRLLRVSPIESCRYLQPRLNDGSLPASCLGLDLPNRGRRVA
jgi:hypothetical protein